MFGQNRMFISRFDDGFISSLYLTWMAKNLDHISGHSNHHPVKEQHFPTIEATTKPICTRKTYTNVEILKKMMSQSGKSINKANKITRFSSTIANILSLFLKIEQKNI